LLFFVFCFLCFALSYLARPDVLSISGALVATTPSC
jgi:hypothetical protein